MLVDSVIGNPKDADEIISISQGGARINLTNGKIYEFKLSPSRYDPYYSMGFSM